MKKEGSHWKRISYNNYWEAILLQYINNYKEFKFKTSKNNLTNLLKQLFTAN